MDQMNPRTCWILPWYVGVFFYTVGIIKVLGKVLWQRNRCTLLYFSTVLNFSQQKTEEEGQQAKYKQQERHLKVLLHSD